MTRFSGQRIGLFGLLGTGNLGNDGSLATVLDHLRATHPNATLRAFCSGPREVTARFAVPASRLNWYRAEYRTSSTPSAVVLKGLGKIIDAFRTAAWVCCQDVVIVPGMGVLESTLPVKPWGFPYSLLLLSLSGKLFGTRVVLLSVGANVITNQVTRWVVLRAASLAGYRSYRDELSRDALQTMGLDTEGDRVYPDLVLGPPVPSPATDRSGIVGVGVMDYHGGDEDREHAEQIHRDYLARLTAFVRWLVDSGRRVRLFTGDHADEIVATKITTTIGSPAVETAAVSTLDDLLQAMAEVDTVVATRYHNVVSALKLGKPTISLGYAAKNDVLMATMGLGEYCQQAATIDLDRLIDQFTRLESRHEEYRAILAARNLGAAQQVERQLAELTEIIQQATRHLPRTHGIA
jgi:polysaccharide pyruvyl transferase WcaK-like protein